MRHNISLITIALMLVALTMGNGHLKAQTVTDLWITGSAVPGGTQKLTKFPNTLYKFAGALQKGEVKIMTTETPGTSTYYLTPTREDSYVVNKGLPFTLTKDASKAGWVVTFDEDRYRFTVDVTNRTLTGELFKPWNELYLVGGATSCGWPDDHSMLPFTRVEGELCTYTWTGELREHKEFTESRRIKINGQNAWAPKVLHPFSQDYPLESATQLRTGGADDKWSVTKDGYYKLIVDVFRETIEAVYLGKSPVKIRKK